MISIEAQQSPVPFDPVADAYDETFTNSHIGRAQRAAVTRELDRVFCPGQRILELGCGTGVDALHLAQRGVRVLACDSSPRMIEVAARKSRQVRLDTPPEFRVLRTEQTGLLEQEYAVPFDGAFSNFAGLNCVADLAAVAAALTRLLRPGASCVFCLFGRVCLWEIFWYLSRGSLSKALRRLKRNPQVVQLSATGAIEVQYPPVRSITRDFAPYFRLVRSTGVGVTVPPSYLEPLARRFGRALKLAASADRYLGRCPGFRSMADHVLLTFQREA